MSYEYAPLPLKKLVRVLRSLTNLKNLMYCIWFLYCTAAKWWWLLNGCSVAVRTVFVRHELANLNCLFRRISSSSYTNCAVHDASLYWKRRGWHVDNLPPWLVYGSKQPRFISRYVSFLTDVFPRSLVASAIPPSRELSSVVNVDPWN